MSTWSVDTLPRWCDGAEADEVEAGGDIDPLSTAVASAERTKFPVDMAINRKIVLWQGDPTRLRADALVNPTNERMSDMTGISERIFALAGKQLQYDCQNHEGCKTGNAVATKGYKTHCKHIVHTVGPRYNPKYRHAAEHALHTCYRNCLRIVRECRLKSVVIPCVYKLKKRFPREMATHTAARTVRRFLEHYGDSIETVVLAFSIPSDLILYQRILPLYMPRNKAEELAAVGRLPKDTGDEHGELVLPNRQIRVAGGLAAPNHVINHRSPIYQTSMKSVESTEINKALCHTSFAKMREDPDLVKAADASAAAAAADAFAEPTSLYQIKLKKAMSIDNRRFNKMQVVYLSGVDTAGRNIVVVNGAHMPTADNIPEDCDSLKEARNRFLLLCLRALDPLVSREYVLVYVHTNTGPAHRPPYTTLKAFFTVLSAKYSKNLRAVYALHPGVWLKMTALFFRYFFNDKFWPKLTYVDQVRDFAGVNGIFRPSDLKLQNHVYKYDLNFNAVVYAASAVAPPFPPEACSSTAGRTDEL